ncbi:MAG: hypothetical protein J1E98_13360 [Lachnospiraceae bacterium]|nr:hypothetical protein [Lachnospiraceae bacterium]
MKCLGIAIMKNEIWYSIVEGAKMDTALICETGKQNYRSESRSLMMDFYNIFVELITKYKPDRVAYKLYLDTKMQQIPYMHYSLGVLNLVCFQYGIGARARSSNWITAGKKAKIIRFENYFSQRNFKNEEMVATLVAWFELEE